MYDAAEKDLSGLLEVMAESKGETGLWAMSTAGEVLMEIAENRTKKNIQKKLAEYGYDSGMEMVEEVQKVFKQAKKLPADYFEAKPGRGVQGTDSTSESVALTSGWDSIEDFADALDVELSLRTFVPHDIFLIYDDVRIYNDVVACLEELRNNG